MLIGATTENPSFEVNAALLSRAKVVRAASARPRPTCARSSIARSPTPSAGLGAQAARRARRRARSRRARGARRRAARAGDAGGGGRGRRARRRGRAQQLTPAVDRGGAAEADAALRQGRRRALRRGLAPSSRACAARDPDAAVYWMARMLEAGEDPLFVLRRMVIFAAEDVGVADPQALSVAIAALEAFRFVGLPEGLLPMTEAALYLADRAQEQHRRHHLRGRQGRRRRPRRAAGARRTCATRPRRSARRSAGARLPVPARLRRPLRARGVPARGAPRPRYYPPSESGRGSRVRGPARAPRDKNDRAEVPSPRVGATCGVREFWRRGSCRHSAPGCRTNLFYAVSLTPRAPADEGRCFRLPARCRSGERSPVPPLQLRSCPGRGSLR